MSARFLMTLVVAVAPVSGLVAQQSSMQTINSAKTELSATQQTSTNTSTSGTVVPQQPATASQGSLGEAVRQQRHKATSTVVASASQPSGQQQKSLGEIAAERRVTAPVHRSLNEEGPSRKTRAKTHHRKRKDPFRQASAAR